MGIILILAGEVVFNPVTKKHPVDKISGIITKIGSVYSRIRVGFSYYSYMISKNRLQNTQQK